ncbi:unnamed protein product [Cochlearia groenlandica]
MLSTNESFRPTTLDFTGFVMQVLPPLCVELRNLVMQPVILLIVLTIAESQDKSDFEMTTLPALVPVLSSATGDTLLLLTNAEHIASHILPLLLRAYNDNDVRIQKEVLKRFTSVAKQLDGQVVKQAILPRVHGLALKTTFVVVRVNTLPCLAELVQTLDKHSVSEILQRVQCCTVVDRSPPTLILCTLTVANALRKQVASAAKDPGPTNSQFNKSTVQSQPSNGTSLPTTCPAVDIQWPPRQSSNITAQTASDETRLNAT